MFARGHTVFSAWWVGWWCWNIPSNSSRADCDRELHANTHAAGKGCLLGARSDPHPGLALCLNLILPPVGKRGGLKSRGLLLDGGAQSQSCCGRGRCTMSAALHECLGAAEEACVHSSSLVALAQVCWVGLPTCLLFSVEERLCSAYQVVPVSWCLTSRSLSLSQPQDLPSVCLEDSSWQILHTGRTVPSCLLPSGTSKGKYQTIHQTK